MRLRHADGCFGGKQNGERIAAKAAQLIVKQLNFVIAARLRRERESSRKVNSRA